MLRCNVCLCLHRGHYLDRKVNSELYDRYIAWKYSVGSNGSQEICWECYNKNPNLFIVGVSEKTSIHGN
jgi:hypothetical protein